MFISRLMSLTTKRHHMALQREIGDEVARVPAQIALASFLANLSIDVEAALARAKLEGAREAKSLYDLL